MHLLLLSSLLASAFALPAVKERSLLAPSVTIKNGTVIGSTDGVVDTFQGVPFAEPPTGSLRLKPPHSITSSFGTITATSVPTQCPQFYTSLTETFLPADVLTYVLDSPLAQEAQVEGEDCLTVTIQRPSGTTSASKLPVVLWFYGGGFEFGSTAEFNPTPFVEKSITLGHDILYIETNYRLNGFGFLAGKELQADGSTNLGLRDQRKAMEWIQENIAAFGGDPTKVTIWGESAGSISVFDHTIINGGNINYNGKPLFRGGIMDSGSIWPAETVTSAKAQSVYDTVVARSGCSNATDSLACLRSVPYETLLTAVTSLPAIFGYEGINLAYPPRPDPSNSFYPLSPELALLAGEYAKVPIIIGDQEDEGTVFSLFQENITTSAELITYIKNYFPLSTIAEITAFVNTYPADPASGYLAPFNSSASNNIYPEFKRLAAIVGDVGFILQRRSYLTTVAPHLNAWSYLATYLHGLPVIGTFHTSDDIEVYGDGPSILGAASMQTYYISFINYLNPNNISTAAPLIEWPLYTTSTRQLLNFSATENTLITDNFRQPSYEFIHDFPSIFQF